MSKSGMPDADEDDAWRPVSRQTLDELRGTSRRDEIGDTSRMVRHNDSSSIAVSHAESDANGTGGEMVELLSRSIADTPYRLDLWMMRFQMYRTLGMKPEYAGAMRGAWAHSGVRKQLDWKAVRAMWEALAPGEPLPEGIELVETGVTVGGGGIVAEQTRVAVSAPRQVRRRFADIALHTAADALDALTREYRALRAAPGYYEALATAIGPTLSRPTSLHFAVELTRAFGGAMRIYLKRDDQRRMAPEIENAVAQAWVAKMMGKDLLVSANDVDAHALALAMVAQRFGLQCLIYARRDDLERKAEMLRKLAGFGTHIKPSAEEPPDHDPRRAALHHWQESPDSIHLALSLGTGPRPYPLITHDFQSLLGRETERQLHAVAGTARPKIYVAALHSESDAIGFMLPHLSGRNVDLYYTEPEPGTQTASRRSTWMRAYNGLKREHAWLRASGRLRYVAISDAQAASARDMVAAQEGFNISLEDARAVAKAALLSRMATRATDIVALVA